MKFLLLLLFSFLLFSCENDTEVIEVETPTTDTIPQLEVEQPEQLIKDTATYPSRYCIDSSWNVYSDIQEGFFLSYTITYLNGKEITVPVDERLPMIGAVDHPEPYYINDTTYFIPHVAGSSLGYFQLYIYKNGSCKYVELISELLPQDEVQVILEERTNPTPKKREPVINNTYSLIEQRHKFKRKASYYGDPDVGCSDNSHSFRFNVDYVDQEFLISGDSLNTIDFYYSETGGLYYAYGHKPYKGSIKGKKQNDNSWLIEIDIWLPLKSDTDTNLIDKHLEITDRFITY